MFYFRSFFRRKYTPNDYCLRKQFWDGDIHDKGNHFEEALLYDVLADCLDKHYYIFPHVSLREIFKPKDFKAPFFQWALLAAYHVDYLIIDKTVAKPLAALELDGASHENGKKWHSEQFKKKLFQQNGIPIFRISRKEKDVFSVEYYKKLLNHNPEIPVYHYNCHTKMEYKNGKNGPFYSCPVCVGDNGKPRTLQAGRIHLINE